MRSPKHPPDQKWPGPSLQEEEAGLQGGGGLRSSAGAPTSLRASNTGLPFCCYLGKGGLWAGPEQPFGTIKHIVSEKETLK